MNPPTDPAQIHSRITQLRREATLLIAELNTAYLPAPTHIRSPNHNFPGPEWQVGRRRSQWHIHTIDGQGDVIYVHHPGEPSGDVQAMEIDYARNVAMAILAACQHADMNREPPPDVPVLATAAKARRRNIIK